MPHKRSPPRPGPYVVSGGARRPRGMSCCSERSARVRRASGRRSGGCSPCWPRPRMCHHQTRRRGTSRRGARCRRPTGNTRRNTGRSGRARPRRHLGRARSWRRWRARPSRPWCVGSWTRWMRLGHRIRASTRCAGSSSRRLRPCRGAPWWKRQRNRGQLDVEGVYQQRAVHLVMDLPPTAYSCRQKTGYNTPCIVSAVRVRISCSPIEPLSSCHWTGQPDRGLRSLILSPLPHPRGMLCTRHLRSP
jgi:hypothetical protein